MILQVLIFPLLFSQLSNLFQFYAILNISLIPQLFSVFPRSFHLSISPILADCLKLVLLYFTTQSSKQSFRQLLAIYQF